METFNQEIEELKGSLRTAAASAANEPKGTPGRSNGTVSKLGVPSKPSVRNSSKSSSSKLSPRAAAAKNKEEAKIFMT